MNPALNITMATSGEEGHFTIAILHLFEFNLITRHVISAAARCSLEHINCSDVTMYQRRDQVMARACAVRTSPTLDGA